MSKEEDKDDNASSGEEESDGECTSPTGGVPVDPNAPLPSQGSAGHLEGTCKRCAFYPRGRCANGFDCAFCHYEHEKRKRKKKKPGTTTPGVSPGSPGIGTMELPPAAAVVAPPQGTAAASGKQRGRGQNSPTGQIPTVVPPPVQQPGPGISPTALPGSGPPLCPPPLYPAPQSPAMFGAMPPPPYPWGADPHPLGAVPAQAPSSEPPQVIQAGEAAPGSNQAGRVMMVNDLEDAMAKAAAAAASPTTGASLAPGVPAPPPVRGGLPPQLQAPAPLPPQLQPQQAQPPPMPSPMAGFSLQAGTAPPIPPGGADPAYYRALLEAKQRDYEHLRSIVVRLEDELSFTRAHIGNLEKQNQLLRAHVEPHDRNTLLKHRPSPKSTPVAGSGPSKEGGMLQQGGRPPPLTCMDGTPGSVGTPHVQASLEKAVDGQVPSSRDPLPPTPSKRFAIIDPQTNEPIEVIPRVGPISPSGAASPTATALENARPTPIGPKPPQSPPQVTPQRTPPAPPTSEPELLPKEGGEEK